MWPFQRRPMQEIWDLFPARPEDKQGHLTDDQRAFIFWAVETSPVVRRQDLRESKRMYAGAVAAGNQAMADTILDFTMSLNGTHLHRTARDDAYWEEYQRVMLGQRADRVSYMVGKTVPTGDRRPWRTHATRARNQPPPW